MITVSDILDHKAKANNVIAPDALVIDALAMLDSVNLSYLIVMEDGKYKGLFCERDYSRNVVLKGRSSKDTKVNDIMTVDLPIVQLSDTAEQCMKAIDQYKTRYLLAFHDLQFRGVITIHDLLRQVLANKEVVFDHSLTGRLIDQDESGKIY